MVNLKNYTVITKYNQLIFSRCTIRLPGPKLSCHWVSAAVLCAALLEQVLTCSCAAEQLTYFGPWPTLELIVHNLFILWDLSTSSINCLSIQLSPHHLQMFPLQITFIFIDPDRSCVCSLVAAEARPDIGHWSQLGWGPATGGPHECTGYCTVCCTAHYHSTGSCNLTIAPSRQKYKLHNVAKLRFRLAKYKLELKWDTHWNSTQWFFKIKYLL